MLTIPGTHADTQPPPAPTRTNRPNGAIPNLFRADRIYFYDLYKVSMVPKNHTGRF